MSKYSRRRERKRETERPAREEPRPKPSVNTLKLFHPSKVRAKSANQQAYIDAIESNDIIFGLGPAGCGKTMLAVAKGVEALQNEDVRKLVLVRPCVGVGRTTGFLPGDLTAKVSPYLRPVLDELRKFYTQEQLVKLMAQDVIELTSLEYMRGRTLDDAVIILDEAQNATFEDMQVFLTRLGANSKYVITGDVTKNPDGTLQQSDLHPREQGALEHSADRFGDLPGVASVNMTQVDIQRHPLVKMIVERGFYA